MAKPFVKSVIEHHDLQRVSEEPYVLVAMVVHKRWNPIYTDSRDQIRGKRWKYKVGAASSAGAVKRVACVRFGVAGHRIVT